MDKNDLIHYISTVYDKGDIEIYAERLSEKIWKAKKTKSINLRLIRLGLTKIPEIIFEMKHLKSLDLSGNLITDLPVEIFKLEKLKTLVIRNNKLKCDFDFSSFKHLKKLYLAGNYVNPTYKFSFPKTLEELQLSHCNLSMIPSAVFNLENLKSFWFTNNDLTAIPAEIGQLQNLKNCYFQGNKLDEIPDSIFEIPNLKGIYLEGNPMKTVPIYKWKGNQYSALKVYYKNLDGSEIINYKGKIILLGKGDVGKTTIARNLYSEAYKELDNDLKTKIIQSETIEEMFRPLNNNSGPTVGIEIRPFDSLLVDKNDDSEERFELKTWDFGGQEIQHNIHHLFLTDNALFLLVWTVRNEENKYAYFKRWLNLIQTYAGENCQVILVLNKADEMKESIDRETLKIKFPQLVDFAEISAEKKTGFNGDKGLLEIIRNQLHLVEGIGKKIPLSWNMIKDTLENRPEKYISYIDFLAVCDGLNVKDEAQQNLVRDWLRNIGSILFYDTDWRLKRTVILKPDWLVDVIYKLIVDNEEKITLNKGVITDEDLEGLIEIDEDIVLQLMKEFDLCFQVGKNKYIIPHLLPLETPTKANNLKFPKKESLQFEYVFSSVIPGMVPILISKMFDKGYLKNKIYWRRGCVLDYKDGTVAKIVHELFPETNNDVIRLSIKGAKAAEFVIILKEEIDHLTKDGQLLSINVPCTNSGHCQHDTPSKVSLEQLERMQKQKVSNLQCRQCFKNISVKNLLENKLSKGFDMDFESLRKLLTKQEFKLFFRQLDLLEISGLLTVELTNLQARHNKLYSKQAKDTITDSEFNIQNNKITESCLSFLNQLKDEDYL